RKKIQHKFTQGNFLQARDFVKFLQEYGIRIDEKTLERYEKEGWLLPALRLIIPNELQNKMLILGIEGIKGFYKDKLLEFPKKGDYEPWSNFKHDYKKGEFHDKKMIFYHSFQIMQVQNIIKNKKVCFTYYDSYHEDDLQKVISNIKQNREWRNESFVRTPIYQIKNIGLLMILEEAYKFHGFGSMSTQSFRKGDNFKQWVKWKKTKFSAKKLLSQCGLTIDEVSKLYDNYATEAHLIDPLGKWYDLTRIMRPSVTGNLKGEALLAQFYYKICRMLSYFIYDLTKKIMPEPDTIYDADNGEWKKSIYSDPFDYTTRKTQRGIIRYFTRDTTQRIILLVEGETEVQIIKKICERLQVDLEDDGINLVNYEGVSNLTVRKLKDSIQISNRDNVPMFIISDNEVNSKEKIKRIKSAVKTKEFDFHVWDESFEADNFGFKKVLKYISEYLKKENKELTKKEVAYYQKKGHTLVHAIEKAYSKKYHSDIYNIIPNKSNISFELMKNRFNKISRDKKIGNPYPIEKVMEQVFRLIPYWG
ncbi:MAG: TOPRIM nucleotidyl transferase/hydrolase domain-containing protein, partial [Nitrosarchaeum sp.]